MLSPDERKVIDFVVSDVLEARIKGMYPQNTPNFFTVIDSEESITYSNAIEYASSYCVFCEDPVVVKARKYALKFQNLKEANSRILNMIAVSVNETHMKVLRAALKGIAYTKKTNDSIIYCMHDGSVCDGFSPRVHQMVVDITPANNKEKANSSLNNIFTFFDMFAEDKLFLKWTSQELVENAKNIISTMSNFDKLLQSALILDSKYPFASIIKNGNAIVSNIRCDYEKESIELCLIKKGGKIDIVSFADINSIEYLGNDKVVHQEITEEQAKNMGITLAQIKRNPVESEKNDFDFNSGNEKEYSLAEQFSGTWKGVPDDAIELPTSDASSVLPATSGSVNQPEPKPKASVETFLVKDTNSSPVISTDMDQAIDFDNLGRAQKESKEGIQNAINWKDSEVQSLLSSDDITEEIEYSEENDAIVEEKSVIDIIEEISEDSTKVERMVVEKTDQELADEMFGDEDGWV